MVDAGDEEAIRRLRETYMQSQDAGDADGCASYWENDGVLLPPNESAAKGSQALRSWYKAAFERFDFDFKLSYDEIHVSGVWSFASGTYAGTVIPKGGGEPMEDSGKFLEIHRRQADGSWKFARHTWNSDRPHQ